MTGNGNVVLDVHGLLVDDRVALESELSEVAGLVANGKFARRSAGTPMRGSAGEIIEVSARIPRRPR